MGNNKLPPIKGDDDGGGRFTNRKKIPAHELRKLAPQQRSRYLAYEEPSKDCEEAMKASMKRLIDLKKRYERQFNPISKDEEEEHDKHAKLIGQLKAAEARNRLRIMRLRYQANRAQEIHHLISCQPVALKAVRLQALVPPYSELKDTGDRLDKFDRKQVEDLLEDTHGLITNRIN